MKPRKPQSKIHEISLHLFAENGFDGTTMDSIAGSLQMTKSNLYLYSSSKRDLYESSIRYRLNKWRRLVASEVRKAGPADRKFEVLCFSAFDYLKKDEDLKKVIQRDPSIFPIKSTEDRFSDINLSAMKILEDIIKDGIDENIFRSVNSTETARYLYSVYIMFIIKTFVNGDPSADDIFFKTAVELNLNGLLIH